MCFWFGFEIIRLVYKKAFFKILNSFYLIWPFILLIRVEKKISGTRTPLINTGQHPGYKFQTVTSKERKPWLQHSTGHYPGYKPQVVTSKEWKPWLRHSMGQHPGYTPQTVTSKERKPWLQHSTGQHPGYKPQTVTSKERKPWLEHSTGHYPGYKPQTVTSKERKPWLEHSTGQHPGCALHRRPQSPRASLGGSLFCGRASSCHICMCKLCAEGGFAFLFAQFPCGIYTWSVLDKKKICCAISVYSMHSLLFF